MSNIDPQNRDIVHQRGVYCSFTSSANVYCLQNKFHLLIQYQASQKHLSNNYREQTGTIELLRMLHKPWADGQNITFIIFVYTCTVVLIIWMIFDYIKIIKGIQYVCTEAMRDEWAPYLECFLHKYQKGICFAHFYILSPKSRGKAHTVNLTP